VQGIIAGTCEILRIISGVSTIGVDDGQNVFELHPDEHAVRVWTMPVFQLFRMYTGMTNRAVTKCLKFSIQELLDILRSTKPGSPALFTTELKPTVPQLSIFPSVHNLQQTLNDVVRCILRATREIGTWPVAVFPNPANDDQPGKEEPAVAENADTEDDIDGLVPASPQDYRAKNYFNYLSHDNMSIAMLILVTNKMSQFEPMIAKYIRRFEKYAFLWESDGDAQFAEFEAKTPTIRDIKEKMDKFLLLETEIDEIDDRTRVGPILLNCSGVKLALIAEAKKWKQKYGDLLNKIGRTEMIKLTDFTEKMKTNLSKNIGQLEDLRAAMESLKKVRSMAAKIDIKMAPIEESYMLLSRYNVVVPQEELEQFEGLTYNWNKLRELEKQQQEILQRVSPQFKNQVVEGMEQFQIDFALFLKQYNEEGPMAPGLTSSEASEKLKIFQHQFDNIQKRWTTYSGGQELFGLQRTELPALAELAKQLKQLSQLYGLYNEVNGYTRGIRDLLWVEVKFAEIEAVMTDFQAKARRPPADMRGWPAYQDLQQRIDNFVDTMPLLEALSKDSVQDVHWKQIIELTGCEIDIDKDVFRLAHVFDAGLLNFKEDVYDICNAAEQEAKIYAKLKEIESDWQSTEFTFEMLKEMKVLLKGPETNEIITKIEDSVVVLSSLNSNRFVGRYKKDVEMWMKRLTTSSAVISEWL
jgi:dynein heavy chain